MKILKLKIYPYNSHFILTTIERFIMGLDEMYQEFDAMHKEFDHLNKRMDQLIKRFDQMDNKIDKLTTLITRQIYKLNNIVIKKGTILYRCSSEPNPEEKMYHCKDTGKTGLYYSTYMLQSLAMSVEHNQPLYLKKFILKEDLECYRGKYSFRYLHPERYFDADGVMKLNIPVLPDENMNHFDSSILCILSDEYDKMFRENKLGLTSNDGELFIGNQNDMNKLELLETYYVPLQGLADLLKREGYKKYSDQYITHMTKN